MNEAVETVVASGAGRVSRPDGGSPWSPSASRRELRVRFYIITPLLGQTDVSWFDPWYITASHRIDWISLYGTNYPMPSFQQDYHAFFAIF